MKSNRRRGAANAVPLVVVTVFFFLFALGAWMWIDMSRSDLEGKAKAYAQFKNRNGNVEMAPPIIAAPPAPAIPAPPMVNPVDGRAVECRRAGSPIVIDGVADDVAWRDAQVVENFSQPWLGPNHLAKSQTRARLLWDDQYLYFVAEMDDTDIYADVKQHNGDLWNNDVFELFFKPSATALGYYEFEINPLNTKFDVYFPSRGSGGLRRWANAYPFHIETKVALRGASTLNEPADRDIGWVVEGRIPWSDFSPTGGKPKAGDEWKFAFCRWDFSVQNDEPEMSTNAPLTQKNFHRYEDYTVLKFK